MVWLIAFLPAPTSQLLPAAGLNQFLNIHSTRLDFASFVALVSAYTWHVLSCTTRRVVSCAQIPGHVHGGILVPQLPILSCRGILRPPVFWTLHLAMTIDKWHTIERDNATNLVLTQKDYIESASVLANWTLHLANLVLTRLKLYRVLLCSWHNYNHIESASVLANWRQRLSACCDLSSLEAWRGTIQQYNTTIQ